MRGGYLSIILLILSVVLIIYASIDYFMMDAELNYWLFFIGIVILFLGIAVRSRSTQKRK